MKPTQEQVIAWAREAKFYESEIDDYIESFTVLATSAYEAGRKDENEACVELIPPQYFELRDRIRARREQ